MKKLLYVLCAVLFCGSVSGQVSATGAYPFATFESHGFDAVNLGNLNVRFSIPVVSRTGRGLPFNYALQYEGLIWSPQPDGSGGSVWVADPGWGFNGSLNGSPVAGYISYQRGGKACTRPPNWSHNPPPADVYSNFIYHDTSGVNHSFNYRVTEPCVTDLSGEAVISGDGAARDGSGLTLVDMGTIKTRTGTLINPPIQTTQQGTTTLTDSNGNQLVGNGTSFTDTTGVTALTVGGNGNPSSPRTYTYPTTNPNTNGTVSVYYATRRIRTNFACSNIPDYGVSTVMSADLVDHITLADGQSTYTFAYEATPGATDGAVTGRLSTITLPTGGQIGYSYSGSNNGISCSDGTPATLTRTMLSEPPQTAWTYAKTWATDHSHTYVVDGQGNSSDYDFVGATVQTGAQQPLAYYLETNRNNWNGGTNNPHQLSQQTCYNNSGSFCIGTAINLPITQLDTFTIMNDSVTKGTTTKWTQDGLQTEVDVYDYGQPQSGRGALLSKTLLGYGGCAPSNLVSSNEVQDGTGHTLSKSTYCYDESALTSTSGVPNHVSASGPRGNLTTATTYTDASSTKVLVSTFADTGSVLSTTSKVKGSASARTQYGYDSTYTFQTSTTLPIPYSGVAMSSGASFDTGRTGLLTESRDLNYQPMSITSYDAMLRPREVHRADLGKTILNYNLAYSSVLTYQNNSVYSDLEYQSDPYGRASRSAFATEDGYWYQQDTCYDGNGRVSFRSYRYKGVGWGTPKVCSGAGDAFTYDVLGRVKSITHGDAAGSSQTTVYSGNAAKIVDENGVGKIEQMDGLGRLSTVCELSSTTYAGEAPISCGTAISGTGFKTTYGYSVDSSGSPQMSISQGSNSVRTFVTDWIGRPATTNEPERGTTKYQYGANSLGETVIRTRPQANQTQSAVTNTTTQYDLLGRILSTTYDDSLTSSRAFQYDQDRAYGDPNSPYSLGASKGRLTRELVSAGNGAGQVFGYDSVGRIAVVGECRPSTCGITADFMNYTYDWEGNLLTSTDGSGVQSTYGYTRANELRSLTSSLNGPQYPANLLSVATQNQSVNGPMSFQFGNGLYGVHSYDSMGRWNGRWVCGNSTTPGCTGGTLLNSGQVTWEGNRAKSGADLTGNSESTYGYDDLGRLTQATMIGTVTTYTYDRYGNRTSQTPGPAVPSVMSNNRLQGFQYDAAGNLMQDAVGNQYVYDAEGNVISINNGSIRYTYDALNQRVRVDEGGSYTEYDFDLAGRRVSEWQGTNRLKGVYYALGKAIGYYDQATTHFQHQDWLGTVRMRTLPDGSVEAKLRYGAYGELQISGSDTDRAHFAGQDADTSTNTSHATFRQLYTAQGKWMSPDPYDGSYELANPQTLNRYAYVSNDPLSGSDPRGLKRPRSSSDDDDVCIRDAMTGQCPGGGGGGLVRITNNGTGWGNGWDEFYQPNPAYVADYLRTWGTPSEKAEMAAIDNLKSYARNINSDASNAGDFLAPSCDNGNHNCEYVLTGSDGTRYYIWEHQTSDVAGGQLVGKMDYITPGIGVRPNVGAFYDTLGGRLDTYRFFTGSTSAVYSSGSQIPIVIHENGSVSGFEHIYAFYGDVFINGSNHLR